MKIDKKLIIKFVILAVIISLIIYLKIKTSADIIGPYDGFQAMMRN